LFCDAIGMPFVSCGSAESADVRNAGAGGTHRAQ